MKMKMRMWARMRRESAGRRPLACAKAKALSVRGGVALAALVALLCALPPVVARAQALDRTLATVRLHSTANIGRNEYLRRVSLVEQQANRTLTDSQKRQLVDAMIDAELIMQDAAQLNIRVRDSDVTDSIEQQRELLSQQSGQTVSERQFREAIVAQTGINWSDYQLQVKNRLIQEMYVLRVKRDLFVAIEEPDADEVQEFYNQNATRFTNPAIVHLEFLLLRTDNVSQSVADQREARARSLHPVATKSVAAFEEQKRASLDDPAISANEIILLRDNRQQADIYGSAFINEVFELSSGFAPAVLQSKVGYHISRVVDKRPPKVLLLNDPILPGQSITVRDQISNQLLLQRQQETLQRAVQEAITDLRDRAEIRTFFDRI